MKIVNKKSIWIMAVFLLFALTACGTDSEKESPPTPPTPPSPPTQNTRTIDPIHAPPDNPTIVLSAKNAYLYHDKTVLLEENDPPNLGSWQATGKAIWRDVKIPADGLYDIGVEYARAYTDKDIWGTINIHPDDSSDMFRLKFSVKPTATDSSEVYTYKETMLANLKAGSYLIEIYPGAIDKPMPVDEQFLKLRNIMLTLRNNDDDDEDDKDKGGNK